MSLWVPRVVVYVVRMHYRTFRPRLHVMRLGQLGSRGPRVMHASVHWLRTLVAVRLTPWSWWANYSDDHLGVSGKEAFALNVYGRHALSLYVGKEPLSARDVDGAEAGLEAGVAGEELEPVDPVSGVRVVNGIAAPAGAQGWRS